VPPFTDRSCRVEDRGFSTPCWVWQGSKDKGYGRVGAGGKVYKVHRVSYEFYVGPFPPGLVTDHLCRVRDCCNPSHLEAVTSQENTRRGNVGSNFRDLVHCKHGHAFDEENTYLNKRGWRTCRMCARLRRRALTNA